MIVAGERHLWAYWRPPAVPVPKRKWGGAPAGQGWRASSSFSCMAPAACRPQEAHVREVARGLCSDSAAHSAESSVGGLPLCGVDVFTFSRSGSGDARLWDIAGFRVCRFMLGVAGIFSGKSCNASAFAVGCCFGIERDIVVYICVSGT